MLNGWKFFSSNAKTSEFLIVMTVTDPTCPRTRGCRCSWCRPTRPGVNIVRNVGLGGEHPDEGSHALIHYEDVRLPLDAVLGGEGQAFAIAQTRLGGGRIHHAMRTIGMCQRAFDMMCERALSREVSGWPAGREAVRAGLHRRLLRPAPAVPALRAQHGVEDRQVQDYRRVRKDIAAIKVLMPRDHPGHRAAARSRCTVPSACRTSCRSPACCSPAPIMGLADGPTEVHKVTVARQVLREYKPSDDIWPTEHRPKKEAAARAKLAEPPRARRGEQLTWATSATTSRRRRSTPRARRVDGQGGPARVGRARSLRFIAGGSQNEIYEVRRGDLHAALRMPPTTAPESRDEGIIREWRIIDALRGTDVPHTPAIAACTDTSVLGRTFYLMGFVDGWSPMDDRRLARAVPVRPVRAAQPRVRARRRHRQARRRSTGRPRGCRTSAGPTASTSARSTGGRRSSSGSRAARSPASTRRRRGCGPTSRSTSCPGSCTATTSSPT